MTDHKQSTEELEVHLQEQLGFLQRSADAYDKGDYAEAKRIAVQIRVLVHDPKNPNARSKSLLGQLGRKSGLFVDSAYPVAPGNLCTHSGLIVTTSSPGVGAAYTAVLDDHGDGQVRQTDFDTWWNATVFIDSEGRELSRKELVLSVAEQDGGAHVDPTLGNTYADLSRNNSLARHFSNGSKFEPMTGPEKAALRQIGHEVLKTFIPGYQKSPTYPEEYLAIGGMSLIVGEPTTHRSQQLMQGRKIGRNEPCPCGSGVKYKRCCGR